MKLATITHAFGLFSITALLGLSFGVSSAPLMNEMASVKTYDCAERITKADVPADAWNPEVGEPGARSQITDFGTSFFVVQPHKKAMAFSGYLSQKVNSYMTGQPDTGITMGKGEGKSAGTYMYIGSSFLISWDCRL